MNINIVFIIMILGHILGDFYFQNEVLAKDKNNSYNILFKHSGLYSVCMGIVLLIGVSFSMKLFLLWIFASIIHFGVDYLKRFIIKRDKKMPIFIIDQILHLISLLFIFYIIGQELDVRDFSFLHINNSMLPARPVHTIVAVLLLLRPVSLLIVSGDIWEFGSEEKAEDTDEEGRKNAGKTIGYLERIIIFFFLLYDQYTAMAFILTAKSVARYSKITDKKILAEDYLIGTLLSVISVMIVSFFCGVIF